MDGEVGNTIAVLVDFDDGCVVGGSGLVVLIPADLTGRVGEGSARGREQAEGVVAGGAGVGVDLGEVELVLCGVKSVMMSAAGPMPEFASEVKRKVSLPAPPVMVSCPSPPIRVSLPALPISVSSPPSPVSTLLPALPVRMLAPSVPMPSTNAE